MTTDHNGNPITMKEPNINVKLVYADFDLNAKPGYNDKSSVSARTNSVKVSQKSSRVSGRFDPKKNLVGQFTANLEAIY